MNKRTCLAVCVAVTLLVVAGVGFGEDHRRVDRILECMEKRGDSTSAVSFNWTSFFECRSLIVHHNDSSPETFEQVIKCVEQNRDRFIEEGETLSIRHFDTCSQLVSDNPDLYDTPEVSDPTPPLEYVEDEVSDTTPDTDKDVVGAGFGEVVPKLPPPLRSCRTEPPTPEGPEDPVKPNVLIVYDNSASMRETTLAREPRIMPDGSVNLGDYDPENDYTAAFQTYLDGLDRETSSLWKHMRDLNNPGGTRAKPFNRYTVYDAYENPFCDDMRDWRIVQPTRGCPPQYYNARACFADGGIQVVYDDALDHLLMAGYARGNAGRLYRYEDAYGFHNVRTVYLGNLLNFLHLNDMRDDLARQAIRDLVVNNPEVNFGLMAYPFYGFYEAQKKTYKDGSPKDIQFFGLDESGSGESGVLLARVGENDVLLNALDDYYAFFPYWFIYPDVWHKYSASKVVTGIEDRKGLIINSFGRSPAAEVLESAYQYFKGEFQAPRFRYRGADGVERSRSFGIAQAPSPVTHADQSNSIIVVTDGRLKGERTLDDDRISDNFRKFRRRDLTEQEVAARHCNTFDDGDDDFALDDLAGCLVQEDLSSTLTGLQTLRIHTLGFDKVADLLQDTADNGQGLYRTVDLAQELLGGQGSQDEELLDPDSQSIVQGDILDVDHVFTLPVLSFGPPGSDHNLYVASFTPDDEHVWEGRLVKYPVARTTDTVQGTAPTEPLWDAAAKLNDRSAELRQIWTIIGTSGTSGLVRFNEENWESLKAPLLGDDASRNRLRDLLVDDPASDPNYEQTTTQLIRFVQGDDVLDKDKDGNTDETRHKLADIFHSRPIEVGAPPYFYQDNGYDAFKTAHASRRPVVYTGSIMLHAFDAATGEELWGFIPPQILGSLQRMIADVRHQSRAQHYVDASPIVDDVFISSPGCESPTSPCWRTVLMAGFRWGARGYFALDVTDPDKPHFLWAVATGGGIVTYWDDMGVAHEIRRDSGYAHGGKNYDYSRLGFTWSEPTIGRIKLAATETNPVTDQWVAVVGGGSRRPDLGRRVGQQVYVIDLADGHLVKHFDHDTLTENNDSNINMGFNAALAGVGDDNGYLQYLYAGDQQGKLWKLDVSGSNSVGGNTNEERQMACQLFDAEATRPGANPNPTNAQNNRRHLYAQPQSTMDTAGNRWLFFGTGNVRNLGDPYPLVSDPPGRQEGNIFVALRDDEPGAACEDRYTTDSLTDVTADSDTIDDTDQGWYIHLRSGEKAFTAPTVYNGYVYFTTFRPDQADGCTLGDSYLYIAQFNTGGVAQGQIGEVSLEDSKRIRLGSGVVTAPLIRAGKIYMGVSGIASSNDHSIIEHLGGQRTDKLIILPLPEARRPVNVISWRETR